jgi:hypothetical protein
MRTSRSGDYGPFGAHELTAAEHRAAANGPPPRPIGGRHPAPVCGRWPDNWRRPGHSTRFPAAPPPKLAHDAGGLLPGFAGDCRAATTFNDVTYGERPGTEPGYRMIADLDERLRSHASAGAGAVRAAEPADTWTPIR